MTLRVFAAVLACSLGFAQPAGEVDPAFTAAAEQLRHTVKIPLRLPSKLPDLGQGREAVYAIVERAAPRSYSIIIGFTPDCNGASVCRIGTLAGSPAGRKRLRGKGVKLKNGVAGRFNEASCGANCSDSIVSWREGANEYTVGVKAGSENDAAALANACLPSK